MAFEIHQRFFRYPLIGEPLNHYSLHLQVQSGFDKYFFLNKIPIELGYVILEISICFPFKNVLFFIIIPHFKEVDKPVVISIAIAGSEGAKICSEAAYLDIYLCFN